MSLRAVGSHKSSARTGRIGSYCIHCMLQRARMAYPTVAAASDAAPCLVSKTKFAVCVLRFYAPAVTRNSDRFWTNSGAHYISTSNAFAAAFWCTPSCSNGAHDIRYRLRIYQLRKMPRTDQPRHTRRKQPARRPERRKQSPITITSSGFGMNMKSRLALGKLAPGGVAPLHANPCGKEGHVRNGLSPPNEPDRRGAAKENSSSNVVP